MIKYTPDLRKNGTQYSKTSGFFRVPYVIVEVGFRFYVSEAVKEKI